MAVSLPTKKITASAIDPRNLIIFGIPKVGKTTLLSTLDNCLILDFESGSDYVDALKIKVENFPHLIEILREIKNAGNPYDFIAVDTISALADFLKPRALQMYKESPQGKNFEGNDVLQAGHGAGYAVLWNVIDKVLELIGQVTKHVIIAGHVKTSAGDDGDAGDIVKTLDLPGNAKRALARNSDAIALLYRDENSNLCFNFEAVGVECGARPQHLANKKIIVAESQEDGTFISHWERIYQTLNK